MTRAELRRAWRRDRHKTGVNWQTWALLTEAEQRLFDKWEKEGAP